MTKGVWQVLASPPDAMASSYLVSNHATREEAYARRAELEGKDPYTVFTVLMVILSDDEWAREHGVVKIQCCEGVPNGGEQ